MKGWTIEDIDRIKQKGVSASVAHKTKSTVPASCALGRLKAGKMNKTEMAYAKHLEVLKNVGEVLWYEFEPMNLRLGDKCFYAVDFLVMTKTGHLECHEVKGFWTDDALVKIKTAAEKFPFRFISLKLKKGNWETREF
jgi:hypothetical protein